MSHQPEDRVSLVPGAAPTARDRPSAGAPDRGEPDRDGAQLALGNGSDVRYIAGIDTFFCRANMWDMYGRSVVGYHLGQTATAAPCATALMAAVAARAANFGARRPVIRTENGPLFVGGTSAAACAALALRHERIAPATPAPIESWHSLLERECLDHEPFGTSSTRT